jgi:hypothetical protein
MNQEVSSFLAAALECSVFCSPLQPGLTVEELIEVASRAGYQKGEVMDALLRVTTRYFGQKLLLPSPTTMSSWVFLAPEDPDFRNFDAFDFVINELNTLAKAEGAARAAILRDVVVERAAAKGIDHRDIQLAITYQVMASILAEKDGVLRFPNGQGVRALPSDQLRSTPQHTHRKPWRKKAYPLVKDIIERRSDGRPNYAEPLDAFADQLDSLNYGHFRLWWKQTVAELRQTDPNTAPTSSSVLAAALVEGVLTFVVNHARNMGRGVFQSKDFERPPRNWKIDDLVASATTGGATAILDTPTKNRAETLIRSRQRIHAGRFLSEFPNGPP